MVLKRLQALEPAITKICQISGTPGLSLGVLYNNESLHKHNYGYRDVEANLQTASDTVYHIGSMTKAFTAAAISVLVENKQIRWDEPINHIVPGGISFRNSELNNTTIVDILSHRMGLERSNQMWHGNDNIPLLTKEQIIPHMEYLKVVRPFRDAFQYSNWGYALAGELIQHLAHASWGNFVQKRLLDPLGMNRSGSVKEAQDGSFAKGYAALDDRSFYPLAPVQVRDGVIMDSSQGLVSTIDDMLKWSQALLISINNEGMSDGASGAASPVKNVAQLIASHTPLAEPFDQSAYGMGWVRTQLPAPLGATGCNPGFVEKMPVVGHGSDQIVLYHQGSLAGYTSSIFLLPSTKSAIVVLTNSISLNDCADWIGQLALEVLLGTTHPNDYVQYAQESSINQIAKFPLMQKTLEEAKIKGTSPKPLEAYVGDYCNEVNDFKIRILTRPSSGSLELQFQGLDSQTWELHHYHNDTFIWLMSRDEAVKRARFPYSPEKLFKLEFIANLEGKMTSVLWAHDADAPPEQLGKVDHSVDSNEAFQKGVNPTIIA